MSIFWEIINLLNWYIWHTIVKYFHENWINFMYQKIPIPAILNFHRMSYINAPFFHVSERGFISLSEIYNRTFHVRSGESLSLKVKMEAYPKPHSISWSFMGRKLKNASDHVISMDSKDYRCQHTQTIWTTCTRRWELHLMEFSSFRSLLFEKNSWRQKNLVQGFLFKQSRPDYKRQLLFASS